MAERECDNPEGNTKGLTSDGAPAKQGWKYVTRPFQPREKAGVPDFAPSAGRVRAVNSADQVHCFNLTEKLIRTVRLLCHPGLQFMSYSEEAEAEYQHLIYFIVMHSDE